MRSPGCKSDVYLSKLRGAKVNTPEVRHQIFLAELLGSARGFIWDPHTLMRMKTNQNQHSKLLEASKTSTKGRLDKI